MINLLGIEQCCLAIGDWAGAGDRTVSIQRSALRVLHCFATEHAYKEILVEKNIVMLLAGAVSSKDSKIRNGGAAHTHIA